MKLKIKKLRDGAKVPTRAHHDDAGLDVYCCERIILPPHTTVKVPTGIAYEIPEGYCIFAWDKGSVGSKGIKTLGGVLDSGYRGELFIPLHNLNNQEYVFEAGDKLAQLVVQKVEFPDIEEVEELSDSLRGEGAFGSTGK
jgi:dUTP pyrophosphatase